MAYDSQRLLQSGDAPPVEIVNPGGSSPIVLIGDHAGNLVPSDLGRLGLTAGELSRHIGWDIGVEALGRRLATLLDAVFVRQRYSRLVIDCNRDPGAVDAVPAESDGTPVPLNAELSADSRDRRVAEIHESYQSAIATVLDGRPDDCVLVSLHSFTPVLAGDARPWHVGVLHDGHNDIVARRLLDWLGRHTDLVIGDNAPYRMDTTDYTVPRHAFAQQRRYVEIEVRQDLLAEAAAIGRVADLLARGLAAVERG